MIDAQVKQQPGSTLPPQSGSLTWAEKPSNLGWGWRVSGQDEAGEQAPPNHVQVAQLFSTAASAERAPALPRVFPICVRGRKPDPPSAAGSDFTRSLLRPPGYGQGGP